MQMADISCYEIVADISLLFYHYMLMAIDDHRRS